MERIFDSSRFAEFERDLTNVIRNLNEWADVQCYDDKSAGTIIRNACGLVSEARETLRDLKNASEN